MTEEKLKFPKTVIYMKSHNVWAFLKCEKNRIHLNYLKLLSFCRCIIYKEILKIQPNFLIKSLLVKLQTVYASKKSCVVRKCALNIMTSFRFNKD